MKRGIFIVLVGVLMCNSVYGQTTKAGVLVIGNGGAAVGAGIQSAVSGAKTVVLTQNQGFELSAANKNLSSGIEQELSFRALAGTTNTGSKSILDAWVDTVKNLTVIKNAGWIKLKRSGSGWAATLSDGRTIKAKVLVNADGTGKVNDALLIKNQVAPWLPFNYENNIYRTSLAAGQVVNGATANVLTWAQLLLPDQDNFVMVGTESMLAGQAAGATASYAAFFDTKTSKANLKLIQGELIKYKLSLVPFADVNNKDSNWKAIQFIGLAGFLKAKIMDGKAYFMPDQPVLREEIKEPVKEYYYKAQIWFEDYMDAEMTIGATLDLVCKVGNVNMESTLAQVKKRWKTSYAFSTELDLKRVITRREFAVLANEYLKPYAVNLDKTGRVVR